jgi:hypothetical protein
MANPRKKGIPRENIIAAVIIIVVLSILICLAVLFLFWVRDLSGICLRDSKFHGLDQRLTGVEHHEPVNALLA